MQWPSSKKWKKGLKAAAKALLRLLELLVDMI